MSLPYLNRDAVVVKPKRKYLDWMRATDEEAATATDGELFRACGTIYLFEPLETATTAEAGEALHSHWREIATSEFEGWWTDEADWPTLKTFADFEAYFEWTYVELIADLGGPRLRLEG